MSVKFTTDSFPLSGKVKDASGLPWGAVIQPYVALDDELHIKNLAGEDIARCGECYAYINHACHFMRKRWKCSLCQEWNTITDDKYTGTDRRDRVPELQHEVLEVDIESEQCPIDGPNAFRYLPIYIALVDLSGGEEYLELVKAGLLAALEALPSYALFGLATYSDRIGMFEPRSPIPHVKHLLVSPSSEPSLGLEEVLSLQSMLAPIGECKDNISAAIESLSYLPQQPVVIPTSATSTSTSTSTATATNASSGPQTNDDKNKTKPRRGFGAAMRSFIDYVQVYEGFSSARLLTFISGVPNFSLGALDENRFKKLSGSEDGAHELLLPATNYYRELAERAANLGLCIDMYVVSSGYSDLASLKFLATMTGGTLMLYESAVNATLPQDIYRQFSRPQCAQGLLRIRTSSEFKTANFYGNAYSDENYDALQHVVGCEQHSTYAVDFEFTSGNGFPRASEPGPIVQVAFAYTVVTPGEKEGQAPTVRRRLRIMTRAAKLGPNTSALYESANPDVVMTVLTHKIIRASLDEGVKEARLLLQDWLSILVTQWNESASKSRTTQPGQVDLSFGNTQLVHLPRYVFALFRHKLMSSENVHPDERIFLQTFYSGLPSHFLLSAIYPRLTGFSDENTIAEPVLCLSKDVVSASPSPIFLLDNFTGVHVYYKELGNLPFPPSQDSVLKKTVVHLKQERHITPLVTQAQAGASEARHFVAALIEDSTGAASTLSFAQFMENVNSDASKALSS